MVGLRANQLIRNGVLIGLSIAAALLPNSGAAVPITITYGNGQPSAPILHWRDVLSINNVGLPPGDFLHPAVMVSPNVFTNPAPDIGPLTSVIAVQGAMQVSLPYEGDPVFFPNEYGVRVPFDPTLTGSWTITVSNPSSPNSPVVVATPTVGDVGQPKFVQNMTLSGNGTTPLLAWSFPEDQLRDRVGIRVYGHERLSAAGFPDIAHNVFLPPNQTSYQIPAVLGDGSSLVIGKRYTVGIFAEEQRNDGSLRARTRSYFEFVAVDAGTTPIYLPSVGPEGVYHFDLTVKDGQPVVIDPDVAIGFDYKIGEGDAKFRSVTLPEVGDNQFDLYLYDVSLADFSFIATVKAGEEYLFPLLGVDSFRVLGIEPEALIDPADTTAFKTTLTFAGGGRFTGTMTPITTQVAAVSEPGTLALFAGWVAAFWLRRQRGRARHCFG